MLNWYRWPRIVSDDRLRHLDEDSWQDQLHFDGTITLTSQPLNWTTLTSQPLDDTDVTATQSDDTDVTTTHLMTLTSQPSTWRHWRHNHLSDETDVTISRLNSNRRLSHQTDSLMSQQPTSQPTTVTSPSLPPNATYYVIATSLPELTSELFDQNSPDSTLLRHRPSITPISTRSSGRRNSI